jgi:hypothetical protein
LEFLNRAVCTVPGHASENATHTRARFLESALEPALEAAFEQATLLLLRNVLEVRIDTCFNRSLSQVRGGVQGLLRERAPLVAAASDLLLRSMCAQEWFVIVRLSLWNSFWRPLPIPERHRTGHGPGGQLVNAGA